MTTVSVAFAPGSFELFALEFSGMSAFGAASSGPSSGSDASTPIATATRMDVSQGDLVVSGVAVCGSIDAIAPGSPFTTFMASDGTAVAYYIPTDDGSYGAAWTYSGTSWDTHTDTFR